MSRPPDDPAATSPSDDLADVWGALDALPRQAAGIDMAATTVEMVAACVADAAPRAEASSIRHWLLPLGVVAASLVAGVVAGRVVAPDPDQRVLESLPLVRHVDLLREAGSMTFLQALAGRRNQLPLRVPPPVARAADAEFDAALLDLEADHRWGRVDRDTLTARSEAVAALSAEGRESLERSLATFLQLSGVQRRDLAAVAAALADPRRQELRAAARLWHQLIAASDPADRKNIVDLATKDRMEWIERRSRPREWNGERRGPPPPEGGPGPRGPAGGPGLDGRPRWPRGELGPPGPRVEGRGQGEPRGVAPVEGNSSGDQKREAADPGIAPLPDRAPRRP